MRLLAVSWIVWGLMGLTGLAVAGQQPQPVPYDSKGRCDPFVPWVRDGEVVSCEPQKTILRLTGIFCDPSGGSEALMNDTWVGIGDIVEGYTVVDIHPEMVELDHAGQSVVLRISGGGTNHEATHPLSDPDRVTRFP